ncbi:MAG: right-handed parallel beta-helix repeat-containing protein [Luteolibacter sp.]
MPVRSSLWMIVFCCCTAFIADAEWVIKVSDFGAIPNDGICDAKAIRAAVDSVADRSGVILRFDDGVYNLTEASVVNRGGRLAMIHLWELNDWKVEGAIDSEGNPATVLEMNLQLRNEITGARHLDIRDCNRFEVRNLVIDQNPRMATAARITEVNRSSGLVRIEILEGMPHFDGMASFSANNWDLATKRLIHGPAVTIGTDASQFGTWSAVPGSRGSYTIQSTAIANRVSVGEGLSFHFNIVIAQGRSIDAYRCTDLVFENVFVYNALGMVMGAGDNRNMTFRRFHVKPEGNSLAVGPRDGIHISRCNGRLLMEDVDVKGVRWDPIVSYMNPASVAQREGEKVIRLDPLDAKAAKVLAALKIGSTLHFWSGADPTARVVSGIADGRVEFTEVLDPSVGTGSIVTPGEWHWDEAVIRRSTIESNYGTAIVFESDNLLVENCVFRNNSYSNIALGPTSTNAGMFTRNIVIRNNLFEDSTWEPKYTGSYLEQHRGTITLFNKSPLFSTQVYHHNIRIEDNLFRDLSGANSPSAIDIKLAKNVTVSNNRYVNVANSNRVDGSTTSGIRLDDIGITRNLGTSFKIESMPLYLDGFQMIRFQRGPNEPVPAFYFAVDRPVTVYLAVHDRGAPTIPANWALKPEKVRWRADVTTVLTDSVYRAEFEAGPVAIPGHNGLSSSWYGVPHMVFVTARDGGELLLQASSFTFPSAPDIRKPDLELRWSGDSMTPFEWALQSDFAEGRELSMFESYLLNRRDMDQPFAVKAITFPVAGKVRLSWPSDGLPNGKMTVRATPDLALHEADWPVLTGTLSHDGQQTSFEAESPTAEEGRMFFRVELSE